MSPEIVAGMIGLIQAGDFDAVAKVISLLSPRPSSFPPAQLPNSSSADPFPSFLGTVPQLASATQAPAGQAHFTPPTTPLSSDVILAAINSLSSNQAVTLDVLRGQATTQNALVNDFQSLRSAHISLTATYEKLVADISTDRAKFKSAVEAAVNARLEELGLTQPFRLPPHPSFIDVLRRGRLGSPAIAPPPQRLSQVSSSSFPAVFSPIPDDKRFTPLHRTLNKNPHDPKVLILERDRLSSFQTAYLKRGRRFTSYEHNRSTAFHVKAYNSGLLNPDTLHPLPEYEDKFFSGFEYVLERTIEDSFSFAHANPGFKPHEFTGLAPHFLVYPPSPPLSLSSSSSSSSSPSSNPLTSESLPQSRDSAPLPSSSSSSSPSSSSPSAFPDTLDESLTTAMDTLLGGHQIQTDASLSTATESSGLSSTPAAELSSASTVALEQSTTPITSAEPALSGAELAASTAAPSTAAPTVTKSLPPPPRPLLLLLVHPPSFIIFLKFCQL